MHLIFVVIYYDSTENKIVGSFEIELDLKKLILINLTTNIMIVL
jgi:hypothetical protein